MECNGSPGAIRCDRRQAETLRSGPWIPAWSSQCPVGLEAAASRAASAGRAGARNLLQGT